MAARLQLSRRRLALLAAGAVLSALVAGWWMRRPVPWAVAVTADASDVSPWTGVNVAATISPAGLDRSLFRYQWVSDGETLEERAPELVWRSGTEGAHHVEVVVEGPGGVTHRARVDVTVYARDYVGVTGARVPRRAQPTANPSLPFGIADVRVEKSEVCQGEPDRITVRPFHHGGPAETKWLRPSIDDQRAWDVTYTPTLVAPGLHQIRIAVMDERDDEVDSFAYVQVKDCVAPYPMFVRYESVAPDPEYVAFDVATFDGPAWRAWAHDTSPRRGPVPRASPARFVWDFGDGETAASTEPFVRHRYPPEARRSNEPATSYAVTVDALDVYGRKMARTTTTVTLSNVVHELAKKFATVQLLSEVPPGPAATLEDGRRSVHVTLRNIHPTETARMTSFVEKLVPCTGKEPTAQPLDVSVVFPTDTVGPSSAISGTFTVPPGQDGICSIAVEIRGTTTPGDLRVTGVFALDTGNRKGQPLTPEQDEVLAKAREHLGGGDVITLADIRRLEDEGVIPRGVLMK